MTWIVSMIGGTCVKRLPYYHVYLRSWSTVKFIFHLLAGWGSTDATWAGGYHSGYHHSKGKLGKQGESHSTTISCLKLICAGFKGLWKSRQLMTALVLLGFVLWLVEERMKKKKKKEKKKNKQTLFVFIWVVVIFFFVPIGQRDYFGFGCATCNRIA